MLQVLYVDCDDDDFLLTKLACKRARAQLEFRIAHTVADAILALSNEEVPLPDLILTEIMAGPEEQVELLGYIAMHERLRHIPVVVYTGALDPALLGRALEQGAHMSIKKGDYDEAAACLMRFAQTINPA